MRNRNVVFVCALSFSSVMLGGCFAGMSFRTDDRLTLVEPLQGDYVQLPVQVSWSADELPLAKEFVVFVDKAPIGRGVNIDSLEGDELINVYRTTKTAFVVEQITSKVNVTPDRADRHEITVIALDAKGNRLGESSDWAQFTVVNV
jgi:hypothetical protein